MYNIFVYFSFVFYVKVFDCVVLISCFLLLCKHFCEFPTFFCNNFLHHLFLFFPSSVETVLHCFRLFSCPLHLFCFVDTISYLFLGVILLSPGFIIGHLCALATKAYVRLFFWRVQGEDLIQVFKWVKRLNKGGICKHLTVHKHAMGCNSRFRLQDYRFENYIIRNWFIYMILDQWTYLGAK